MAILDHPKQHIAHFLERLRTDRKFLLGTVLYLSFGIVVFVAMIELAARSSYAKDHMEWRVEVSNEGEIIFPAVHVCSADPKNHPVTLFCMVGTSFTRTASNTPAKGCSTANSNHKSVGSKPKVKYDETLLEFLNNTMYCAVSIDSEDDNAVDVHLSFSDELGYSNTDTWLQGGSNASTYLIGLTKSTYYPHASATSSSEYAVTKLYSLAVNRDTTQRFLEFYLSFDTHEVFTYREANYFDAWMFFGCWGGFILVMYFFTLILRGLYHCFLEAPNANPSQYKYHSAVVPPNSP